MTILKELFKDFEFNNKTEYKIKKVKGIELPKDYLDFMDEHNGGEGKIGENGYAKIYKLEELEQANEDYEISKYFQNYFIFGTDGGEMLLGYNSERKLYYAVDACNIDENEIFYVSESLLEFFKKIDE
ncbi:hypothetical protein BCR32DRAFT_295488 [Anaeromyces robustus]|uniref:Knr4/Smi1-like domain-containing protein n=1 Tax=Anaeromyces robustus TaxID=1754192 RepID=A0A1Y1WVU8_9FUNG|nr:hypothetical protein BCR32DRAFT_295488 [Anaeromyces robustus]|eukprot:ORX77667.1 hypothetical protein BCR32DRAFT_295488 [Anaeromyces robustus]